MCLPIRAAGYLFTARMLLRQSFDPWRKSNAQKAARLIRDCRVLTLLLGELFLYKSRVPEAIEQFQKELSVNPANATTLYKLADAYSRIQNMMTRSSFCSAQSGWTQLPPGPYILMGKVLSKKG